MTSTLNLKALEMENGQVQAYAWPGGYPMFFVCEDNGVLCPACVNKERKLIDAAAADHDAQWNVVAADINYEDDSLYCDNCSQRIESAYAEPEADAQQDAELDEQEDAEADARNDDARNA